MVLLMVDCENCSIDSIEYNMKHLIDTDVVCVVGPSQSEFRYASLGLRLKTIKCQKPGKNSADFVLVADLVTRLATGNYIKAIIMSNDNGYDAAILHLNKLGYDVVRIPSDKEIMSTGLADFLAYMVKRFKSGAKFASIVTSRPNMKDASSKYLYELARLGIIRISINDTKQVYFSKDRIKEIVKHHNAELRYIVECNRGNNNGKQERA